jgi:hypothetical protein
MLFFVVAVIQQNSLIFNRITGGILCAISNVIAQQLDHSSNNSSIVKDNSFASDSYLASSQAQILSTNTAAIN